MIKDDFEFIIVSSPDREKVTCEIYFKNEIFAEISQETDGLTIEIFSTETHKWWSFPLDQFQQTIEDAKKHLLGLAN